MERAEFILGCCERFSQLPSAVMREGSELLQLLAIEDMGRPDE